MHEAYPRAETIAIKSGQIVFVGPDSAAAGLESGERRVIDLHGKTVVPGFIDAHCHLSGVGARELNLNLEGATSLADFLARVKARVDQTRAGQWVTGRGWIETSW